MEGMTFVLIILFCFVLPIVFFGTWTTHKQKMREMESQIDHTEKDALKEELAGVKKRLEVLEAIVTDKKYQLDQEIRELQQAKH